MALPAVLLVLVLLLQAASLAVDSVRCVDAARVGARAAARGDDGRSRALAVAPSGSGVAVTTRGGEVVVDVQAPARGLAGWVAGLRPHAHAVAAVEGAGPPGQGP